MPVNLEGTVMNLKGATLYAASISEIVPATVHENDPYPRKGGPVMPVLSEVLDQWRQVLPTGQVVPAELTCRLQKSSRI